jgi:hypothetical protein
MMKSVLALGFMAIVSLPLAARASVITGVLNFTGSVTISFGKIAFDNGNVFNINPANTQQGGFMALGGTAGMIDNIMNPPDATGVLLDVPDFITFAAAPNISITLTELLPGIDGPAGCADTPPAADQLCTPNTPAQSPFNLENTSATSSTASFNILGIEVDSLTGNTIPITGAFSQPFTDTGCPVLEPCPFQTLLADVAAGIPITTSFSGQIATVGTPEPSAFTELFIGMGIIALGICLRYRKKSAIN